MSVYSCACVKKHAINPVVTFWHIHQKVEEMLKLGKFQRMPLCYYQADASENLNTPAYSFISILTQQISNEPSHHKSLITPDSNLLWTFAKCEPSFNFVILSSLFRSDPSLDSRAFIGQLTRNWKPLLSFTTCTCPVYTTHVFCAYETFSACWDIWVADRSRFSRDRNSFRARWWRCCAFVFGDCYCC